MCAWNSCLWNNRNSARPQGWSGTRGAKPHVWSGSNAWVTAAGSFKEAQGGLVWVTTLKLLKTCLVRSKLWVLWIIEGCCFHGCTGKKTYQKDKWVLSEYQFKILLWSKPFWYNNQFETLLWLSTGKPCHFFHPTADQLSKETASELNPVSCMY